MTLSSIGPVAVPAGEWSRYYTSPATSVGGATCASVVPATAIVGGTLGDSVYAMLRNRATGRVVSTKTLVLAGASQSLTASFDLKTDCLDADGIFRAVQGEYEVIFADAATAPYLLSNVSNAFTIVLVGAGELRDLYLGNINLRDENLLRISVEGVTGVVGGTTREVQRGGYLLRWNVTDRTLEWGDYASGDYGPPLRVPLTGAAYFARAWNHTMDQTVDLTITPTALPGGDVNGYLYVDYYTLDDGFIANQIKYAYAYVNTMLGVPIEPRLFATNLLLATTPYVESVTDAQPYRRPNVGGKPILIDLPLRRVLKLHSFGGYFRGSKTISLDPLSLTLDEFNGYIHITLGVVAGTVAGPLAAGLIMGGLGGMVNSLGQFWQFAATAGLSHLNLDEDGRMVREAVMRVAQTNVLLQVGRAQAGTATSEVFNRDGSSYSRQFSQGQYGLYSDIIGWNVQWWQQDFMRLKKRIVGIVTMI